MRRQIHSGLRNPRRRSGKSKNEEGIIIVLTAIFMLFVVGAMAALAIDVTTFYTARSEAQIAADGAALAAARALANSGMTSDPNAASDNLMSNAEAFATAVALQVASSNPIGGKVLSSTGTCTSGTEISVCYNDGASTFWYNPHVTVQVQRTDLPTFFARIWGTSQVSVGASATAEAYNSSGASASGEPIVRVAPICVKPWLLPNMDPTGAGTIFDTTKGTISNTALLGLSNASTHLHALCESGNVSCPPTSLTKWQYLEGDDTSFPHPTTALPACTLTGNFQTSIGGCVQTPIVCGSTVTVDTTNVATLDSDATTAVDCLTHTSGNQGDKSTGVVIPPNPFEFIAEDDNPLVQAGILSPGKDVMVSDSLVTVPVFDNSTWTSTTTSVQVIGFVQLFLQPSGFAVPTGGPSSYQIRSKIINMIGCGTTPSTATPPVYGNGPSAVPVRLITPP